MFNKMDKAVLDDDNYNELYRIHTGHALFGSGSDSDSLDEPVLIDSKPPLYTFDELNANLVVIGATSNQNKSDLNESPTWRSSELKTDQILQKELEKLIFHNTCLLCGVGKCSNHDFENHKRGKTHRKNVEQFIGRKLETLENKKDAENSYCNGNIQNKQSLDLTKHEKENLLADLIHPTYCNVCDANLSTHVNANEHYKSWRHKSNVLYWKGAFTSGLQQKPASHNVEPNYCFMCNAKLPGSDQAKSHLKSNRHKTNVKIWINKQKLKLQEKNKNSVKTLQIHQNITNTSTVQKSESICKVCGIMVGADFETHSLIDEHKRNVEAFCFVCNIKTMSKEQLAEHVKGRRHKNNLSIQKSSSSLDIPRSVINPVREEDISNIDKILVHSNKSQLGLKEKSSIDNQTQLTQELTINSADKNENISSSQDIPNETYKEIKPAETTIDKNKTSSVSQEFNYSDPSTSKEMLSYFSGTYNYYNTNSIKIPINIINMTQYVSDKVEEEMEEIKSEKRVIEENEANEVSKEFNESNVSTKTVNIPYSKKVVETNSKYCQTEEMEEITNKSDLGGLHMEMEKFTCALNSVPVDIALLYLQNCTKKLEEGMKNGNVLDIEVDNRIENNVQSKKGKKKKKSVFKPFFRLNSMPSKINIDQSEDLNKAPKSKTNYGLSKVIFCSAVGILFFWSLKKLAFRRSVLVNDMNFSTVLANDMNFSKQQLLFLCFVV